MKNKEIRNDTLDYVLVELSYLIDNFDTTYLCDMELKLKELKSVLESYSKVESFRHHTIKK